MDNLNYDTGPLHSGGNLGVRLGLELDKNIFKSIQKYFKSIQKYLTHTNSGLAHPKLFGSKYFWYVKYFYSYMSLFGQKLKFCFLCPMKTNFEVVNSTLYAGLGSDPEGLDPYI